ncbi:MAG: hypothetical protein H6751_06105 [Candidatus Omnitrophica bacterium]|nr:hypothetical protein [Candidatus Omnitrophota bacterium]
MTEFHFQLGRERELCLHELENILSLSGYTLQDRNLPLPGISSKDSDVDPKSLCTPLGGCVRAIERIGDYSEDFLMEVESGAWFLPEGPWAISALDPKLRSEREKLRSSVKTLVKQSEQAHGREERPKPGELDLSPAKIQELGFADTGSELCLWKEDERILVGITRWVFDTQGFGDRDMNKPFRPRRRGLLPPKLARQMINLGRTPKTWKILDPFCGCGVTLLEGLDLGFQVAGSDNRDEAIKQSAKNVDWYLSQSESASKSSVAFIERIDARQLSTKIAPLSLDLVVGEGDLGPPIQGKLSRKAAAGFSGQLEPLYSRTFAEVRTTLRPGGRVCLAIPFWQPNEGDPIFINIERKLRLIGYEPAFDEKGFEPFLYRRKDQRVGRAIYVLKSPE